jgi:hypothetical protein
MITVCSGIPSLVPAAGNKTFRLASLAGVLCLERMKNQQNQSQAKDFLMLHSNPISKQWHERFHATNNDQVQVRMDQFMSTTSRRIINQCDVTTAC